MNSQPKTFDNFDFSRVKLLKPVVDWNKFVEHARAGKEYKFKKEEIEKGAITEFVHSTNDRLILLGLEGRGKSHLAEAILRQHRKRAIDDALSQKMTSGDVSDHIQTVTGNIKSFDLYAIFFNLQAHIDHDVQQDANYEIRQLYRSEVLLIDDLSSEKETEKEVFPQGFLKLLDNYTTGKLIITTNRTPRGLFDRYKPKIFSRMFGNALVILITGPDSRFLNREPKE